LTSSYISANAILYISNQYGEEDWLAQSSSRILLGASGGWQTKVFTFELPEGYTLRNIFIRVWFDASYDYSDWDYRPQYKGYILIDDVTGLTGDMG
jgi:hypothetical protein